MLVLEGFFDSFPKGFSKLGLSYLLNRAVKVLSRDGINIETFIKL